MSRSPTVYSLIWNTAVPASRMRKFVIGLCAVFAVAGGVIGAAIKDHGNAAAVIMLVALPSILLALLYWLDFVHGVVKQLTPANAALVPGVRQHAIDMVLAFWLAFTLFITIVMEGAFGHSVLWVAAAAVWLLGSAMNRVGYQSGMVFQLLPLYLMAMSRETFKTLDAFVSGPAGIASCAVLLFAMACFGKRMLFPVGERHFAQFALVEKGLRKERERAGGSLGVASALTGRYAASLEGLGQGRASAGTIILHALGPIAHWSTPLHALAGIGCGLVAFKLLLTQASPDMRSTLSMVSGFIVMPLVLLFMSGPKMLAQRALETIGEQSLLRMAPVVADMRMYNAVLGTALLKRAVAEWAVVAAALVGAPLMAGAPLKYVLLQLGVCCLALPLTTLVLRDYARSARFSCFYPLLAGLYLTVVGAACWFALSRFDVGAITALAAATGLTATFVMAVMRARAMDQAPLAFPAGRMA